MPIPKYKIGDLVHVLPDVETIYKVVRVHREHYQTLYDVVPLIEKVQESQMEPVSKG